MAPVLEWLRLTFVTGPGAVKAADLKPLIDHARQTVTSSTGELKLDYGKGLLIIDAPRAQGLSGLVHAAGPAETRDLSIASDLELGHLIAVSLDGQPLATSRKILQVMSEEKPSNFQTEPAGEDVRRVLNIGVDPWLLKPLHGTVRFKRPDAAQLKVTALDFNGYPAGDCGSARQIELRPGTMYYLLRLKDGPE